MTARAFPSTVERAPVEAALRHLGARRYGPLVEIIEHAINRPDGRTGTILAPLTEPTAVLSDWSVAERADAVWALIEEGIRHPEVSSTAHSRRRYALQAAFRLPDEEIGEEWGASLSERFKQLRALRASFRDVTSNQPLEIAWKRGVERLADHMQERFAKLRDPADWASYRSTGGPPNGGPTMFRPPSEGAQKLVVNLYVMTVLINGRVVRRRISERLITSRDDNGLKCFTAWAFSSESRLQRRSYTPLHALWGCRAEHVEKDGMPVTYLWFPRPLRTGEQAHFVTETFYDAAVEDVRGWANVDIDHYGIEPGELRDGVLPVKGLTIRIRFDRDFPPTAAWWYAETNERERYVQPPVGSPRRLEVVDGDVVKTFEHPCHPRESYGIAYKWD